MNQWASSWGHTLSFSSRWMFSSTAFPETGRRQKKPLFGKPIGDHSQVNGSLWGWEAILLLESKSRRIRFEMQLLISSLLPFHIYFLFSFVHIAQRKDCKLKKKIVFAPLWHQKMNDYNSYMLPLWVSQALYPALIFTEPHVESQNFEGFEEHFQSSTAAVLFWKWGERGSSTRRCSDLSWECLS